MENWSFRLTLSGCGRLEPCCSTLRKLMMSIPLLLARCMVGDRTSLVAINFFKHFGARSSNWLHFESLSTTMTLISAENYRSVMIGCKKEAKFMVYLDWWWKRTRQVLMYRSKIPIPLNTNKQHVRLLPIPDNCRCICLKFIKIVSNWFLESNEIWPALPRKVWGVGCNPKRTNPDPKWWIFVNISL